MVVGLLLWAGPADAQFFVRVNCTTDIPSPQLGWTCSETSTLTLKQYNGTTWATAAGGAILNGLTGAVSLLGTANQIGIATGATTITISAAQNIAPSSSPTFAALTLSAFGGGGTQCLQVDNAGVVGTSGATCGGGGGAGVSAINTTATGGVTIQGTANRVTVTTVGATLTVSLPNAVSGLTSLSATTILGTSLIAGPIHDKGGQVYNVLEYGFVADGATDNVAAFNALSAAVGANAGAEFRFPFSGSCYVFASTVTISVKYGLRLMSAAALRAGNATSMPCLRFTGAAGSLFALTSEVRGLEIAGFNIQYTNAAYAGDLIDVTRTSGASLDWIYIHDSAIGGNAVTGANSLIKIGDVLKVEIERVTFHDAKRHILGTASAFANGVTIRDSFFNPGGTTTGVCQIVAGGQAWNIENNIFEPINTTGSVAASVCVTSRGVDGLKIHGNWFGDSAAGTYIDLTGGPVFGASIGGGGLIQGISSTVGVKLGAAQGVHFSGANFAISGTDIDFGTSSNVTGERSNTYQKGLGLGTDPVFVGAPTGTSDYRRGSVWQRAFGPSPQARTLTLAVGIEATSFRPWLGVNALQGAGDTQTYATSLGLPAYRWSQSGVSTNAVQLQVAAGGTAGNTITWLTPLTVSSTGLAAFSRSSAGTTLPTDAVVSLTNTGNGNSTLALDNTGVGNPGLAFFVSGALKGVMSFSRSTNAMTLGNLAYSTADFMLFLNADGSMEFKDPVAASVSRFKITAAGKAYFKTNASVLPAFPGVLQVADVTGSDTNIVADSFGGQGAFVGRRANGTPTARTAVLATQPLANLIAAGAYDATNYSGAQASLGFFSAENWSASALGTVATLAVTPKGSTILTEAMRWEGITGGAGYRVSMSPTNTAPTYDNSRPFFLNATTSGSRKPSGTLVLGNQIAGFHVKNTDSSTAFTGGVGPPTDCLTGGILGICTSITGLVEVQEQAGFTGTAYGLGSIYYINGSATVAERAAFFAGGIANSGSNFALYGANHFVAIDAAVTNFNLVIGTLTEIWCGKTPDCTTKGVGVQIQNRTPSFQGYKMDAGLKIISNLGVGTGFPDGDAWTNAISLETDAGPKLFRVLGNGFTWLTPAAINNPSFATTRPLNIDVSLTGTRAATGGDFVTANTMAAFYAKNTDASQSVSLQLGDRTSVTGFVHASETSAFTGTGYALASLLEINGSASAGERGGSFSGLFVITGSNAPAYGSNSFLGVKAAVGSIGFSAITVAELNCQIGDCLTNAFGSSIANVTSAFGTSQKAAAGLIILPTLTIGGGGANAWGHAIRVGNYDGTDSRFVVSGDGDMLGLSLVITSLGGSGDRTLCIHNNGVVYTVASGAAC